MWWVYSQQKTTNLNNAMEIGNLQTHLSFGWFSQIQDGSAVVLFEFCFLF